MSVHNGEMFIQGANACTTHDICNATVFYAYRKHVLIYINVLHMYIEELIKVVELIIEVLVNFKA